MDANVDEGAGSVVFAGAVTGVISEEKQITVRIYESTNAGRADFLIRFLEPDNISR